MRGKKKIRRRPGTPRNMYFTKETGESIVKYCEAECLEEKKKIYEKEILPAFEKLAENLIFVYGFKSPYASSEELKVDCVSFMFETLHKWDPSRGSKAFSYFNVVAKNWFIINTRKHLKRRNRHISIDDPNGMSMSQKESYEKYDYFPSPDIIIQKQQVKNEILSLLDDMRVKLTNENELKCLHAIETLFSSIENLDILNKRAVLLYIREISGLDKKYLSKAMSSIRKHYRAMSANPDKYDIF